MPSTYSTTLRLQLMTTGEKTGQWGSITNTNLGTLLEQAITGISNITVSDVGNTTLTAVDGATDQSRSMYLNLTGALTGTRSVLAPSVSSSTGLPVTKLYVVKNSTTGGQSVILKTSAVGSTGVTVPNGAVTLLWSDGTNVTNALTYLASVTNSAITNSTLDNSPVGSITPSTGAFTSGTAANWNITTGGTLNNVSVVNGGGNFLTFSTAAAVITGGSINSTPIGATTPATGVFTSLSSTGGALNGTVGLTTPGSGAFTSLSSSSVYTNTTATGTAPMAISSTTRVTNLNVERSGYADTATIADDTSTATSVYPLFSTAVSGQRPLYGSSTKWTFVPSTGVMTTAGLSVGSLTGLLKGTSGVVSAATAGTDYVTASTATNFTALQTFTGSQSTLAAKLVNAKEGASSVSSPATGTITINSTSLSILYYTQNATGNFVINLTGLTSPAVTLDSLLSVGECITLVFLATQGSTAYYATSIQVDGTTSGLTTKWQGGDAPVAGNINSIDSYTFTVLKTASATFTVLASLTQFK